MSQFGQIQLGPFTAPIETVTGDAGGAVGPTFAGNVDIVGGNNITTTGTPGTNSMSVAVTGTTDHTVQIGNATGSLTSVGVGLTAQVLKGNTAADPSWGAVDLTTDVTGMLPVGSGGTGVGTLTDHGVVVGSGVAAVTVLAAAGNGELIIGSVGADPVLGVITSARNLLVANGAGTIDITLDDNTNQTAVHINDGIMLEHPDFSVTSDGATITFAIEKDGGGDLTLVFSDGFYDWDTTPADTVTLTAGSDTAPQANYVYVLQATKALTVSTVNWPVTEFAPIAKVLCQSAASLQPDGAYSVHKCLGSSVDDTDKGLASNLTCWIRRQNSVWWSGVAQTLTITPQGVAADNVIFTSAAGIVLQLERKTFPAFVGTPDVYTVNDSVTAYNVVTDLNALLTDSTGASMSGRYFPLVIWGVASENSADCKLMVNLPGGSYGNAARLAKDANKYANFSIPSEFKGTGFLIYQMNLRHQVAAGGTWTSMANIDLRGLFPSLAAGGSTAFATEFEDSTFRIVDNGDNTKELAFECSPITIATTRTITMDDRNIDLDAVPDSFATDAAAATPAAGILTVAGGTGLTSSGAGSTVTINLDTPVSSTNGGLGVVDPTDHSVLVGSGAGAVTPIAVGGTGELLVGAAGADPAFGTSAGGDFTFTTATAGATRTLTVSNTDATGANYSSSELELISQSASTGDPFVRFNVNGGQDYALGVDNSDSDALKITDDADPSTGNELWKMTSAGERTMPLQSAFMAIPSGNLVDVTGDNTVYTIVFATETYDQNNDFDGTSTFTAPVTGKYNFSLYISLTDIAAAMTNNLLTLVTTGKSYKFTQMFYHPITAILAGNGVWCYSIVGVPLTAADTALVQIRFIGGAKVVDIIAADTSFSGYLAF